MPLTASLVHRVVPVLTAALLFTSAPAFAANDALVKLLGLLRDRGSITAEEYADLAKLADPGATPATAPAAPPAASATAAAAPAATPALAVPAAPAGTLTARVQALEKVNQSGDVAKKALAGKWYEKISLRGYTQFRMSEVAQGDGELLEIPADRSVNPAETFVIRRGRFIFSGDASDRIYLYAQSDFQGSTGAADLSLQARDLYADFAIDAKKTWRVRAGLSKVPFGWSNLQSSQNRLALERPDSLNSSVEGERDFGVYLMWASTEARQRFKDLVNKGLKGSGDYGVVAAGFYSGQGLNRSDVNGEPHLLGRVSYPFKTKGGQFWELGVAAHKGKYVTTTQAITTGGATFTPSRPIAGVADDRIGGTFVLYPQPFGIEAEWNAGRGPELSRDYRTIEAKTLHGGYLQASYRLTRKQGVYTPFARWQYFDGGRKFGRNSPADHVNEADFGVELTPWPEVELTLLYTRTAERTRTSTFPFLAARGANRFGLQFQFNY